VTNAAAQKFTLRKSRAYINIYVYIHACIYTYIILRKLFLHSYVVVQELAKTEDFTGAGFQKQGTFIIKQNQRTTHVI